MNERLKINKQQDTMTNKTATVQEGMWVSFIYTVTDQEGNVLFEATSAAPDTIIYGVTPGVLPGLERAMRGLKAGDGFNVTLPAADAYGEYDKNVIFHLPYDIFASDGKLPDTVKVGASLPMMTDTGQKVYGVVTDISPDKVTMDFNHPFAGKTVTFSGEVREVRPATDEELHPKGCGGCCGGGCGSDSGCSSKGDCSDGGCCGNC